MKISINRVHFPVTTLGAGQRLGIWTQGCGIRCPGCCSKDTWEDDAKFHIDVDQLVDGCADWISTADGVTISGGEPFDQAPALKALLQLIRARTAGDILVYSGFPFDRLATDHRELLELIDVVVSEPYVPRAGATLALRGSDNQRIHLLSNLARARYPMAIDSSLRSGVPKIDVSVEDDQVWFIGIPEPGFLAQLKHRLAVRDVVIQTSDQLPAKVRA